MEIYDDGLPENLKPISEMTEADLEIFKTNYDFFMLVYNRTFVQLNEQAVNRAIAVICAMLGYQCFKIGPHRYAYQADPAEVN